MGDLFFVLIYLLVPTICYGMVRLAGIDILRISVPSLFILHYMVAAYVGTLPLYFGWNEHAIAYGVIDHQLVVRLFLYSASTLILICLGLLVSSSVISSRKRKKGNIQKYSNLNSRTIAIIVGLCLFSVVVLLAYLHNLPGIPLMAALRGNPEEAVALRTTLSTTNVVSFGRMQYYKMFYLGVTSFLSTVLFAEAIRSRRKSLWFLTWVTFLVATFGSIVETSKGASYGAFLPYYLTYLVAKDKRINIRFIVIVCLPLAVIVASILYIYFLGTDSSDYMAVVGAVFGRVLVGNMTPTYHVLDMFQSGDYLLGRSFPNPRGIFPYNQFNLDEEIWLRIFPQAAGSESLYTAPSVFWAELYANFGPLITLSLIPLIGISLNIIQALLTKLPPHPVRTALIVLFSLHFMGLAIKGVSAYMWDYNTALILLIAFILFRSDRKTRGSPA